MRHVFLGLLASLALAACGKTQCEKYADMEWKCGDFPASEEEITRTIAEGMCEGAKSIDDPAARDMAEEFQRSAECAAKYSDCPTYKACRDATTR